MYLPVRVHERQTTFWNTLFPLGMDYVTWSRLLILRLFSSKIIMYVQLSSKFQATVENSDLSFIGVPLLSWRLRLSFGGVPLLSWWWWLCFIGMSLSSWRLWLSFVGVPRSSWRLRLSFVGVPLPSWCCGCLCPEILQWYALMWGYFCPWKMFLSGSHMPLEVMWNRSRVQGPSTLKPGHFSKFCFHWAALR